MRDTAHTLLWLLAQSGVFFALAAWLLHRQGLSLTRVGLRRPTIRQVCLGIGLGVALFVASYSIGTGTDYVLSHLLSRHAYGLIREKQWAEQTFVGFASQRARLAFILIGTVAAPLGEEAFFRGYLYYSISKSKGVKAGIVYSSLIFGVLHFGPPVAMCVICLIGFALACVTHRTQSLWPPILMHGVNNALSFVVLWNQLR